MNVKRIKRDFERERSTRVKWHPMWQLLGEYVSLIKQNFETQPDEGEFLTKEVYDSTAVFAAKNAASAMLGMLWPGTARQSFEIVPPEDVKSKSTELSEFYEKMTTRATAAMDSPAANLSLALDEYMLDQMIFGTSGVGVEYDEENESGLMFKPYGVREMYVSEGRNGKVNGVYLFFEWCVDRVVDEYGIENVSEAVRKKYEANSYDDKIKILVSINPRKEKKAQKGKLAMPYEALHIEFDTEHVVKEDGFRGLPVFVGRFRKLTYERYGRSPAMDALADIREANTLREAVIIATEKNLDPPLGVLDDGMLGGNTIDTSAGATVVFNAAGNLSGKQPVFPLVTVGSLADALKRLEDLERTISQHFSIDRLLDMNNEQQMTFGEAQIRNQIRTASLSALFMRQIVEVLTPLIERSVELLFTHGVFGVMPGSEEEQEQLVLGQEPEYIPDELIERIKNNQDIYTVRYKTPAANAARAQEYMAILDMVGIAGQAMQIDQSIAQRVDLHEGIKRIADIRGLPVGIIRQDDKFNAIMDQQAKQQQAQQGLMMAQQMAATAKDAGQAKQAFEAA